MLNQSSGQSTTGFNDIPSNFWAVKADRATQSGFLKDILEMFSNLSKKFLEHKLRLPVA